MTVVQLIKSLQQRLNRGVLRPGAQVKVVISAEGNPQTAVYAKVDFIVNQGGQAHLYLEEASGWKKS